MQINMCIQFNKRPLLLR